MASGGMSEREQRLLKRSMEKEMQEIAHQRDRLLREYRARIADKEKYRYTRSLGDDAIPPDINTDTQYRGYEHERGVSLRSPISLSTENITGLNRGFNTQDNTALKTTIGSLSQEHTSMMADQTIDLTDRHSTPHISSRVDREGGVNPQQNVKESQGQLVDIMQGDNGIEKEFRQLDKVFDTSVDEAFRDMKQRLDVFSNTMFTIDASYLSGFDTETENANQKDQAQSRTNELEERERILKDREETLNKRDNELEKRETHMKDLEKSMVDKMQTLEKEYKVKEMQMFEKEKEIHMFMRDTEQRINEKLEKMELKQKRKDEELVEREMGIDRLQRQWHEKFQHLTLLQEMQEKVIQDKDSAKYYENYTYLGPGSLREKTETKHVALPNEIKREESNETGLAACEGSGTYLNRANKIENPKDVPREKNKETKEASNSISDKREEPTSLKYIDNLNAKLNLTSFSGMEPVPRNEASFEEWKLEVESVKAIYSDLVVKQAIRKALKGQAKRIMLHLGPHANVNDIENKLEDAFGNIASRDSILSHFFLAEQDEKESIVEWGLRLEEMLLQASRKTQINGKEKEDMLKRKFWRGLQNEELKNATRVHFEKEISYEELRRKVRAEDFEIKVQKEKKEKSRDKQPNKARQSVLNFSDERGEEMMKILINKMEQLDEKVETLKKENDQFKRNNKQQSGDSSRYDMRQRGRGNFRGGYGYGPRGRGRGKDTKENDTQTEDQKNQADLNKKSSS